MEKYVKIKILVELELQFNQCMKSDKITYIIYADLESLINKRMDVQTIQKTLQQQK